MQALYTPQPLARACLGFLRDVTNSLPDAVLEPYAGGGAFGQAALALWPDVEVRGCDTDVGNAPFLIDRNRADEWEPSKPTGFTWVVTNPGQCTVADVAIILSIGQRAEAVLTGLLLPGKMLPRLLDAEDPPSLVALISQRVAWEGPEAERRLAEAQVTARFEGRREPKQFLMDKQPVLLAAWFVNASRSTAICNMPQWRAPGKSAEVNLVR